MDQLIKPQNLSLSREQLAMLMPYLIMAVGAMASLLAGVMGKSGKNLTSVAGISIITILAAIYSVTQVWGEPSMLLLNNMLAADYYSNLFNVVLLAATGLVLLSSYHYLEREGIHYGEYYSLALFSCLGMMILSSALDLVVLFVALEVMSIGVYVMVGFRRADVRSNEAALKYFILGSAASAIMLFGVALVYGATGTMNIGLVTEFIKANGTGNSLFILGAVLVIVGFLFKVATVPFHMWMPDVYEGAPTTVTSFMTTGLKAAAFASFMRVFMSFSNGTDLSTHYNVGIHNVLWVVAVLTMFLGNVIALTQTNIKRMLAYSSIAHTGYIIVGFIAAARSESGFSPVIVYLVAYVIMNIGAFAIVALLGEAGDRNTDVQDYSGLGFKNPALGFAMAVFMFSMAGIPPTVGFAGKYMIFSSAVQAGEITLAILAVLCSAISAYYYLRVIVFMYMKEPIRDAKVAFVLPSTLVILAATLATLQFGIFPSMLIHAARKAANI